MGKTPTRSDLSYWQNGSYDWISISDLNTDRKYISDTKERITTKAVRESGIKKIPANTVIMSFKLSIGKTAITSHDMFSNEAIMAFIDRKVIRINPDYIYYLLHALDWNKRANKAVKGRTVNKKIISQTQVNIPDYQTQLRIVKIMDSTRKRVKIQKDILSKLDTLIKARFVEMFGNYPNNEKSWPVGKIKDLVLDVRYGTSKKATDGTSGKYPYLRMNNITYDGNLNLSDLKTIDLPLEDLEKYTVQKGDLLFNRTNSRDLVGKTCVYDLDKTMVLAGFIIRVRLDTTVANPVFVSKFLNTGYSKLLLRTICKNASGQSNINAKEMQNIKIYVPPISLQNEFANFVQQVDKSKVAVQKSLEETQTLFDSLMQKYFS